MKTQLLCSCELIIRMVDERLELPRHRSHLLKMICPLQNRLSGTRSQSFNLKYYVDLCVSQMCQKLPNILNQFFKPINSLSNRNSLLVVEGTNRVVASPNKNRPAISTIFCQLAR
jgi:hypothetical protein